MKQSTGTVGAASRAVIMQTDDGVLSFRKVARPRKGPDPRRSWPFRYASPCIASGNS